MMRWTRWRSGVYRKPVNWVLDADIRDLVGQLNHAWLRTFLGHRIAEKRILRLVDTWLAAGVIEDRRWTECDQGSPQGASVSPLLAHRYRHDVLDLWVDWWRHHHATGDVIIVGWADDFVVGFEHEHDARPSYASGWRSSHLAPHPDKTRLLEFGRDAARRRAARGLGKPETVDFLGFTHIRARSKSGWFWPHRSTISKRTRAKRREIHTQLKRRRHQPIPKQGRWLASVVRGHNAYSAVPGNLDTIKAFHTQVTTSWREALRRRSQKTKLTWDRMNRIAKRW